MLVRGHPAADHDELLVLVDPAADPEEPGPLVVVAVLDVPADPLDPRVAPLAPAEPVELEVPVDVVEREPVADPLPDEAATDELPVLDGAPVLVAALLPPPTFLPLHPPVSIATVMMSAARRMRPPRSRRANYTRVSGGRWTSPRIWDEVTAFGAPARGETRNGPVPKITGRWARRSTRRRRRCFDSWGERWLPSQ